MLQQSQTISRSEDNSSVWKLQASLKLWNFVENQVLLKKIKFFNLMKGNIQTQKENKIQQQASQQDRIKEFAEFMEDKQKLKINPAKMRERKIYPTQQSHWTENLQSQFSRGSYQSNQKIQFITQMAARIKEHNSSICTNHQILNEDQQLQIRICRLQQLVEQLYLQQVKTTNPCIIVEREAIQEKSEKSVDGENLMGLIREMLQDLKWAQQEIYQLKTYSLQSHSPRSVEILIEQQNSIYEDAVNQKKYKIPSQEITMLGGEGTPVEEEQYSVRKKADISLQNQQKSTHSTNESSNYNSNANNAHITKKIVTKNHATSPMPNRVYKSMFDRLKIYNNKFRRQVQRPAVKVLYRYSCLQKSPRKLQHKLAQFKAIE